MKTEEELINDDFNTISTESTIFVSKLTDITDRINHLLEEKGWSQKDLANALGKKESQVSKWLTTMHNFTLRSIARIEAQLGADIINVPSCNSSGISNYVYLKVKTSALNEEQYSQSMNTTTHFNLGQLYGSIEQKKNKLVNPVFKAIAK